MIRCVIRPMKHSIRHVHHLHTGWDKGPDTLKDGGLGACFGAVAVI